MSSEMISGHDQAKQMAAEAGHAIVVYLDPDGKAMSGIYEPLGWYSPGGVWHPLGEQAVPEGSLPVAAAPPCPECERLRERIAELDRDEEKLVDERDAAEEAVSQAYYLITGESPEWSNFFGHKEALEEIDRAQTLLRQRIAEARQQPGKPQAEPHPHICGPDSNCDGECQARYHEMQTVDAQRTSEKKFMELFTENQKACFNSGANTPSELRLLLDREREACKRLTILRDRDTERRQELESECERLRKQVVELEGQLHIANNDRNDLIQQLAQAQQSPAPGLVAAAEALIEAVKQAVRGQPGGSLFHSCMVAESALAAHRASQQGQTGLTVGAVMAVVDEQLAPMMLTAAIADNLQVVKDKIRGRLTTLFNSEQGQLHKIYCQACKTPRTFDPGDTITAPITCDKCGGALTFGSAASEQVAATSETEVTRSGEHVVVNGDGCGFSGTVDNALATFAIMLQEQSRRAVKPLPTVPRASVTRDGEHVTIIGKGFQFDGTVDNALGNFAAMTHMYCERGERRPAPASSGQVVELFVARSEGDKSDCWLWFNKPAEMLDGCWISSGKLPGASHLPDKYRDLIPPGTCVPCKLVIDGDGDRGIPATPSASCAVYFTGTHPAPTDQQLLERIAEQTAQIIDQTAGDGVKAERKSMARAVDAFLDRHKASSLGSIDALIQRQEKELADADSDRLELNKQRAAALAGTCYATLAELRAAHDNCQVFRKATDTHCDIAIAERDTLKLALADAAELMAKNHADLIAERDRANAEAYQWRLRACRDFRRIAALKGVITKLKRKEPDRER